MTFFEVPHWNEQPRQPGFRHRNLLWLAAAAVGTIAVTGLVFANQQPLQDHLTIWLDDPDPAAAALGETLALTDDGEFVYAASSPVLAGTELFSRLCGRVGSDEVNVLGCYADRRIVVFDIEDDRLQSFEQVTAAHELLHGVWMRMSVEERDRVGALLNDAYEGLRDDPLLADRLAWYAQTEPGQRLNELHSILGTEIAELPDGLERHYGEWFTDRQAIVEMNEESIAVFAQLERRAARLGSQLDDLERQIDERRDAYEHAVSAYNDAVADFNQRADNGDFASSASFEAERDALMAQAAVLDAERQAIDALIDEYNELLADLKRLDRVARSLDEALDSRPDR